MRSRYVKGRTSTWIVTWMGGQTVIDYRKEAKETSPDAVYIPRVGVFVSAKDINRTRTFIPTRSIMEIRSLSLDGGDLDDLAKWMDEQFLSGSEKLAKQRKGIFDEDEE